MAGRSRAARFKRAYKPTWHLSNQKEAFVKTFFESLGFIVKFVGLGAGTEKYIGESGSKPDLLILGAGVKFYVEVTGANRGYRRGNYIYITYDKYRKYYPIAQHTPVLFVFLGFQQGILQYAGYAWFEDLYPYAEDPDSLITRAPHGIPETYIRTPAKLWRPLKSIVREISRRFYPVKNDLIFARGEAKNA